MREDAQRQTIDGLPDAGIPTSNYYLGQHIAEHRDDDPAREPDEWESPHTRHPVLPEILEDIVIACPHGLDDDRNCHRCMDTKYGSGAPVIAATRRKVA